MKWTDRCECETGPTPWGTVALLVVISLVALFAEPLADLVFR